MANAETEYVIKMRDSLGWFHDESSRYIKDHGLDPKPGSIAQIEHDTYSPPERIVECWALWNYLVELCGEHVTLFVKSLTEPVEAIACYTCVRSMMESCALGAWLVDPTIDAATRRERVLAHRYAGMKEQVKFAKSAGRPATEIAKAEGQQKKLGDELGVNGPKGKSKERPSATNMITMMLDEEKNYRMLSAVAHGHFWAIHGLCYKQNDESPDLMVGSVATKGFKKVMKFEAVALMGSCVFKAMARPLWNHCQYFGWDALRLEELIENVADKLTIRNERRFWRNSNIPAVVNP